MEKISNLSELPVYPIVAKDAAALELTAAVTPRRLYYIYYISAKRQSYFESVDPEGSEAQLASILAHCFTPCPKASAMQCQQVP